MSLAAAKHLGEGGPDRRDPLPPQPPQSPAAVPKLLHPHAMEKWGAGDPGGGGREGRHFSMPWL